MSSLLGAFDFKIGIERLTIDPSSRQHCFLQRFFKTQVLLPLGILPGLPIPKANQPNQLNYFCELSIWL